LLAWYPRDVLVGPFLLAGVRPPTVFSVLVNATSKSQDIKMGFITHADVYTNRLGRNHILAGWMATMFNKSDRVACSNAFIHSTVDVEVDLER
jgi:hypothetical protein